MSPPLSVFSSVSHGHLWPCQHPIAARWAERAGEDDVLRGHGWVTTHPAPGLGSLGLRVLGRVCRIQALESLEDLFLPPHGGVPDDVGSLCRGDVPSPEAGGRPRHRLSGFSCTISVKPRSVAHTR